MSEQVVKGFLEDWEGTMVLGDKRNYENAEQFKQEVAKYLVDYNRTDEKLEEVKEDTIYIINDGSEWVPLDGLEEGQDGEPLDVYCTHLVYEN